MNSFALMSNSVSNNNVNLYIPTNLQVVTGYTNLRVSFNTKLGTNFTGNIIGGVGISSSSSPIVFSGLTTGTAYSMYVTNLFNNTLIKSKTLTVSTASYPIITNAPASTSIVLTITNPTANTTYSGNTTTGIVGVATGNVINFTGLSFLTAYTINVYANFNGFFASIPSINVSTTYLSSDIVYRNDTALIITGNTTSYNYIQVTGSGNITFNLMGKTLYYIIVGGGASGGTGGSTSVAGVAGAGGGGGGVYGNSVTSSSTLVFTCTIGAGGAATGSATTPPASSSGNPTDLSCSLFKYTAPKGSAPTNSYSSNGVGGIGGNIINNIGSLTNFDFSFNSTNGRNQFITPSLGVKIQLDSTNFYFSGGGGGGSDALIPSGGVYSTYGGGFGGLLSVASAGSGKPNSGSGSGGERTRNASNAASNTSTGAAGCVFFFWSKNTTIANYVVTISGGVYWLTDGLTNLPQRTILFVTGGLYYFDQSHETNFGNRLVLGNIRESVSTKITSNFVVYNGTPGTQGAYTRIDLSGVTVSSLYYFSESNIGLGTTPITYTVTVSGGVYYFGAELGSRPSITFTPGGLYVFDQSSDTNLGNTLVIGSSSDVLSSIVRNNVVINGTAGTVGAYTLLDLLGMNAPTLPLYYFSSSTMNIGTINGYSITNINVLLATSTNIIITWITPIITSNLTGYNISIGGTVTNISTPSNNVYTITGLTTNQLYNIGIQAIYSPTITTAFYSYINVTIGTTTTTVTASQYDSSSIIGDFTVLKYTGNLNITKTVTLSSSTLLGFILVGGGGSGGCNGSQYGGSGGGGGGGTYFLNISNSTIKENNILIKVGSGGSKSGPAAYNTYNVNGNVGNNSSLTIGSNTVTCYGGGGGSTDFNGGMCGVGGNIITTINGGVSYIGGNGGYGADKAPGSNLLLTNGNIGASVTVPQLSTTYYYGGGGGGGRWNNTGNIYLWSNGYTLGGGGDGQRINFNLAIAGNINSGGGGGGSSGNNAYYSGEGGSGYSLVYFYTTYNNFTIS